MPLAKDTNVGIKSVQDTGVVQLVHPNDIDHDVLRDATNQTATHPEPDLVVLTPGKTIKVREWIVIDGGYERLRITKYKYWAGRRTARTQYHEVADGHIMSRSPR